MVSNPELFSVKNNILFEDNHLLVVNKPAGVLVQGDITKDKTLLDHCKAYIKQKYSKPGDVYLHPVHRIDRPVSGAVIFARTSKSLSRMTIMFQEQAVKKTYLALVAKRPNPEVGELIHYLDKDTDRNKASAYTKEGKNRKKSILKYRMIGEYLDHFILEITPETGRPHQIRVQLATMGFPIIGDLKYGYPTPNPDKSIFLHAYNISFYHPVNKERIFITASLPEDLVWKGVLKIVQNTRKQ